MHRPIRRQRPLLRLLATGWCATMLAACGVAAPPSARTDGQETPRASGTAVAEVLGEVRLPDEARSPSVERLRDGTPVSVVNHGDGDVSVLAATVLDEAPEPRPGDIRGLRTALVWDLDDRRFLGGAGWETNAGGHWDLRGRAITPDGRLLPAGRLDRHRASVRADRVVVSALVPGEPRAVDSQASERPPMPVVRDPARLRTIGTALDPPLPIDRALAEPDGSVVLLDASIVRNGSAPPTLCAIDMSGPLDHERARCPDGAPRPSGLTVPVPDTRTWEIRQGPLLARVDDRTFSDVAQLAAGSAGGAGSIESMKISEATRVTVADGSVGVVEGWAVVDVQGSDVCSVLTRPRTLYVVRGRIEPCDEPQAPALPGAVVRAVEDDPETASRLRTGARVPLYGTPGRFREDATAWLHPDVFTYDYVVTDLRLLVSIADDPHPGEPYSYMDNEAVLRSLRRE